MRLLTALLIALVLAVPATAETSQRLLIDPDVAGYPLVTIDAWDYFSHVEGLYGVGYSASIATADTAEFFCDNGVSQTFVPRCRVWFLDTDGTAAPVALIISTDATRDSIGTGLTEYKLDEGGGGTISSAWYLNPAGTNGTVIARYLLPHNTWFTLPEWLGFTSDYRIGIVLADTAYVNFEVVWTETE